MATKEELKQLAILDVAQQLGMELKRVGHNTYSWVDHDSFIINTSKNIFSWFSRDKLGGDVFSLVQTVKEELSGQKVSFKEAKNYLETGEFKTFEAVDTPPEPFSYYLGNYESRNMNQARDYLKTERGLSDETIDLFVSRGLMAQATKKSGNSYEPVIVFKTFDKSGELTGASLQGIQVNYDLYDRGRLKQIMRASDGMNGMTLDIGQPQRLVFAESPIDLMSYYELNQHKLQNVRLVAMDGLKEATVSRHFAELWAEREGKSYTVDRKKTPRLLEKVAQMTNTFDHEENRQLITLAVDNDEAGHRFVSKLQNKGIPVIPDLPPIGQGQTKMDWNDYLKQEGVRMSQQRQTEPRNDYYVHLHYAEGYLGGIYEEGQVVPYQEFATALYKRNDELLPKHLNSLEIADPVTNDGYLPYEKVRFDIQDKNGREVFRSERYDVGEETYPISKYLGNSRDAEAISKIDQLILEQWQQPTKKSLEKTQGIENAEGTVGDFPEKQEAAPLPEADEPQPLNDLSPSQTQPQPLLHFTITAKGESINKRHYHEISEKELRKLNRYTQNLQQSANWYLNNLSGSELTYFYSDGQETGRVTVNFEKEHFMHLTGIFPIKDGQTAEKSLLDFAQGRGDYDNILIANQGAAFDKLQVLPELQEVVESDAFYFDDLSDIEKFQKLNLDKAIRTSDKDLLLALRSVDGTTIPASVMKIKNNLNAQLDKINTEKTVLGVYRNRDGIIDQLSINEDYIKDGGAEMLSIMQNNLFEKEELAEEIIREESPSQLLQGESNKERMTSVIDAVKEVGRTNFTPEAEEKHAQELAKIDELLKRYYGNLDLVITDLALDNLLNKDGSFYQEWVEDKVFERHQVAWTDVANGEITQEKFSDLATETLDEWTQKREDYLNGKADVVVENKQEFLQEEMWSNPQKVAELIASNDVKGLSEHMKAGIKTYLNSDQYKDFLRAISKLPNYSVNNIMLLLEQKHDVSAVASFNVWKEKFDRKVNKGEKALRIWAPMKLQKKDPETGEPLLDENGKPQTYIKFKLVPVFDISQTNGKEFPKPVNELEGSYEDYANLYRATRALAAEKNVSVELSADTKNAKGYYSPAGNKIVLKTGMSETQTLKTFFHELAHATLHNQEEQKKNQFTTTQKELQAESIAFVMASHFGIDTSEYSFGYLANWSDDKQHLSDLEAQLGVVQTTAKELITRLDNILELQQDKTKPRDKFSERMQQAQSKVADKTSEKEVSQEEKKPREQPQQGYR